MASPTPPIPTPSPTIIVNVPSQSPTIVHVTSSGAPWWAGLIFTISGAIIAFGGAFFLDNRRRAREDERRLDGALKEAASAFTLRLNELLDYIRFTLPQDRGQIDKSIANRAVWDFKKEVASARLAFGPIEIVGEGDLVRVASRVMELVDEFLAIYITKKEKSEFDSELNPRIAGIQSALDDFKQEVRKKFGRQPLKS
jgi:hypothetical protein